MQRSFHTEKSAHPEFIYSMISKIKELKRRNLLRGYSAKSSISSSEAEVARRGASLHDSLILGGLLKSKFGILEGAEKEKKSSADIFRAITISPLEWRAEVNYTVGYINAMESSAVGMLGAIKELVCFESLGSEEALNNLLELSVKYGASNYLSYKLAYLRSSRELSGHLVKIVSDIEEEIGHREKYRPAF